MAQYEYWPRYGLENYSHVLPGERGFDSFVSTKWMQEHWHHSITLSAVYVVFIYAGQKVSAMNRPASVEV